MMSRVLSVLDDERLNERELGTSRLPVHPGTEEARRAQANSIRSSVTTEAERLASKGT